MRVRRGADGGLPGEHGDDGFVVVAEFDVIVVEADVEVVGVPGERDGEVGGGEAGAA